MKEEITPDEVKAIMEKDHKWSLKNPDWIMNGDDLPSGITKLDYLPGGDKERGYARMLLHLRTGQYIAPENLLFDTNKLTYYTLLNKSS